MTLVPERSCRSFVSDPGRSTVKEDAWLKHVAELLNADSEQSISRAAFHSTCEVQMTDLPAVTATLPLFHEKSDTPAMNKHSMDIITRARKRAG